MPISMESFASEGAFATYDPWHTQEVRVGIFRLECRGGGHEMDDPSQLAGACPKCGGHHFERIVIPGSVLANAQRQ